MISIKLTYVTQEKVLQFRESSMMWIFFTDVNEKRAKNGAREWKSKIHNVVACGQCQSSIVLMLFMVVQR